MKFLLLSFSSIICSVITIGATLSNNNKDSQIICSEKACIGTYQGAEFIDGSDIAHQFSNKMSNEVGNKLKDLYRRKLYSKVDFHNLKMSTHGMGTGTVIYKLTIPFIRVKNQCDAYTSFDHVGGWNHKPALEARKIQLKSVLMDGEKLAISDLKKTPEGLQEYWIQWKHKSTQNDCVDTATEQNKR